MSKHNRLSRAVGLINRLPARCHPTLLSLLFGSQVRFAGTAGVRVIELRHDHARLQLRNRRKVRNHIQGVHAAATALLAESASGFLTAMNVPDERILLIRTLQVAYQRRAQGDLYATASLTPDQRALIAQQPAGEVEVAVQITDESAQSPVECRMVWAWRPKSR